MNEQEIFYTIALTRMTGFNSQQALQLYQKLGGGQAVYEQRNAIGDVIKSIHTHSSVSELFK